VLFDPLFLDCHAIGNDDLPGDHDELGFIRLNRTCGHSTSAWCQLGNGLRIVNGGGGQWKRLRSRLGHALDDDKYAYAFTLASLLASSFVIESRLFVFFQFIVCCIKASFVMNVHIDIVICRSELC